MTKTKTRDFEYSTDLAESVNGGVIDRENGIIRNVVLLTGEKVSRNKTFYTKKALSEAVDRYEGAKMYLDHPKENDGVVRSVKDLGGIYRNVRIEESRFLKADLHLLPNDSIKNLVIPIAEAKPAGVGLSIRDRGKGRDENGVFLVESFAPKASYSIDLVTEASVNENLFESIEGGDMKIEEITLDDLQKGNPALVEAIQKDARDSVLKEVEEKIAKGENADKFILEAKKAKALAEAGFTKEVAEKVGKLIEADNVSAELAEGIIRTHKEIIAATPPAGAPKVTGHGDGKAPIDLNEVQLPTDAQLAEAVENA